MPVGASAQGIRSAGFSPGQISSLEHWYDATKLSGFSDGNSVGTWPDEEGSNDLTQGTGSAQPTYKTNVINNNPVVQTDGTDDLIDVSFGSTLSQPNTIFAVAQAVTAAEDATEFVYDGVGSSARNALFSDNDTNSNQWGIIAGSVLGSGTAEDANPHAFTALYNSTSSTLRLDGTQIASGDAGSNSLTGFRLGANFGSSAFGDFSIGEVLIYDADLSTSDRDAIESYLSDKWGITI